MGWKVQNKRKCHWVQKMAKKNLGTM